MIDERAIVDPAAEVGSNVTIGPWSYIGSGVKIDDGTVIGPHVVIKGPTTIGKNNRIFQFASLGDEPQDKKYQGEDTTLEIGDGNTIREFVTINRGTSQDIGYTKIGNNNWIMAYVHIAHDCVIGDENIMANNASLAGHVIVGDHVVLGGFSGVHQFCKIGNYCFLGRAALVGMDIPPYLMVVGNNASVHGLNIEGLKRNGFSLDTIKSIKQAFKIIYRQNLTIEEVMPKLDEITKDTPEVQTMIDFLKQSKRGILRKFSNDVIF